MKIGILTSGGDAPGMNTCVARLVTSLCRRGHKVVGIMFGYKGLLEENFVPLTQESVQNVSYLGGSFLKSYRCPEFKTEAGVKKGVKFSKKHKFDAIIAIGGDGTLKGVKELNDAGVNVTFIPATIDNDVMISEKSLGFDTAINNAVEAIDMIEQTMATMDRGMVVETMGRDCPDIAISCGLAVGATMIITPESDLNFEHILQKLNKKMSSGDKTPIIIVQEHVLDIDSLAKYLEQNTNIEFRSINLGYIQRGGAPTVADRILAIKFAKCVVDSLERGEKNRCASILNDEACVLSMKVITKNAHKSSQYLVDFVD